MADVSWGRIGGVSTISISTPSAAYRVAVGPGLLRTVPRRVRELTRGKTPRVFVVTSPLIWELWSEAFLAGFAEAPEVLLLPAGERHKRLAAVEDLAEQMARAGADRDSLLVAFGGGVIGDITGFLAAIYMRGIPYVQIPTTLLAQVDSSVGGKTGVNLAAGKNLIGSFHHPLETVVDPEVLGTLPAVEMQSGLQEAVKTAIIRDPELFVYLERHAAGLVGGATEVEVLTQVVTASIQVKADVVNEDERENGVRMILNFGHTIGHAIESATEYRQMLHGQAVGWGSVAALEVSLGRGCIDRGTFERMVALVMACGPLPRFQAEAERLVALTGADKKRRSGRRAFVLTTGIGSTEIVYDVSDEELLLATRAMLDRMRKLTGHDA